MAYGASFIAVLWAVFWIWFDLVTAFGARLTPGGILLHVAMPGLFFALLLLLAWWTEVLGGLLLLSIGVFIAVALPISSGHLTVNALVFVVLTLALPPLAAGIMFLVNWRMKYFRSWNSRA